MADAGRPPTGALLVLALPVRGALLATQGLYARSRKQQQEPYAIAPRPLPGLVPKP